MEEVYQFLLKEMEKYNGYVIAGISGGPDSMALLHLLIRLREELDIKIVCAHVNHNVRTESAGEAVFLRDYCIDHNVQFEMMKIENYGDDNFHNEARNIRYQYFNDLILKYNAKYLLTAHHGDDLMETILMRIVRGSTFKGYAGFSKIVDNGSYKILRPLITVTKNNILDYLKQNDIKYVTDQSNFSDKYTRNRYRKYAIPFLKSEEPSVHEKFLKFSQTIIEYNDYMDLEMKNHIDEVYNNKNIDILKFKKLNKIVQDRMINYILEMIYQEDLMLVTDVHTTLIKNLIDSSKPNAYIYLPNNIKVVKSYNVLSFTEEVSRPEDYNMELNSIINLPNGKNIEIVKESDDNSNYVCRLSSKDITLPLYVRSKNDGDRIQVKGMKGSKKIKDIFINEKVSPYEREMWPVVVDKEGIVIWLPGLKKSKYDKSKNESYDIIIKYY